MYINKYVKENDFDEYLLGSYMSSDASMHAELTISMACGRPQS
jgi:hypothetical protein